MHKFYVTEKDTKMNRCQVKYKFGKPGRPKSGISQASLGVYGNTESAVMEELRKRHRDMEIVIVSIKWK